MTKNPAPNSRLAQIRRLRERAIASAQDIAAQSGDEEYARAQAIISAGMTPSQARSAERRAIVAKRLAEGATLTAIARELNVTPSRIWQLRKAMGI